MKLTKSQIDKFAYEKTANKPDIRWDSDLPNFGIRVYPSGKKSFVLSYRHSGRKHLMVIGQYGVFTLSEAKEIAKDVLGKLRIDKSDPLEDRYKHVKAETFDDLCHQYIKRYARSHKKSWQEDERRIDKYLRPAWGTRKAYTIKRADVAKLHNNLGKIKPYEANRVLALISKIFSQARKWGIVKDNHINPTQDVEKFKEHKRDRWVTPQEMPKLAEAINSELNEYARYAIWLYLLTGARKSEILTAKWKDIDWNRMELKLRDTKSGRDHYIPLSSAAVNLLRKIPVLKDNPYIIVGAVSGRHLVNIDKAWRRIRAAASLNDVRLHDLRRTVGSMLVQSGSSLPLIGQILNHSNQATTKIYARFSNKEPRKALENHGNNVLQLISTKKVSNSGT